MNSKLKAFLMAAGLSSAAITGAQLTDKWEGNSLTVYVDAVGVLTACRGHTNKDLKLGQRFTEQQCMEIFAKDIAKEDKQLLQLTAPVRLTHSEHAAYLSFLHWAGYGNFASSTLRKKLLAGDRVGACKELTQACSTNSPTPQHPGGERVCNGWTYGTRLGVKVRLNGLIKRRAEEQAICLSELTVGGLTQ
ncbi:lysozyme [Shewanella xiamenensis]|uniref:lysozyme n=1 Tax=Shewanella xiamenensis TaxID=332186 RepID=UPI00255B1FDD|nr:lysozyme [Shewanella xiamenensis]MDL3984599.1 lysozyme [Shewanella xiamenensis]